MCFVRKHLDSIREELLAVVALVAVALVVVIGLLLTLGVMQYRMFDRVLTALVSFHESQHKTFQHLLRIEQALLDRRYR